MIRQVRVGQRGDEQRGARKQPTEPEGRDGHPSVQLTARPAPSGLLQVPGHQQGKYNPLHPYPLHPHPHPHPHPRAYFRFQGINRVSTIPAPSPAPTPRGLLQVPRCQQGDYHLLHPHPHPRAYFIFKGVTRVSIIPSTHNHIHTQGPTSGSRVSPG